ERRHRGDVVRDAGGLDVVHRPRAGDQERALAFGEHRDRVVTGDGALERADPGLAELPDPLERGLGLVRADSQVTRVPGAVVGGTEEVPAARGAERGDVVGVALVADLPAE